MSRNLSEGSTSKDLSAAEFGVRQLFRRPGQKAKAVLFIKLSGDRTDDAVLETGDKTFQFEISEDMDGLNLTKVEGYVTTVSSSGSITVQLAKIDSNGGGTPADMLTTKLTIASGDHNSKQTTPPVIDTGEDDVAWGDHIRIDVDSAGTGTKGLGVMLTFS